LWANASQPAADPEASEVPDSDKEVRKRQKSPIEARSLTLFGLPVDAGLDTRARFRWAPDGEYDRDFYALVSGELGDPRRNHVSGGALGRLAVNLGASGETAALTDQDDTYGDGLGTTYFRLYHAHVEGTDLGPLMFVRGGRIFVTETPDFLHFDGGRVRMALLKSRRLWVEGYGGSPVHFYQGDRLGDVVTGAAIGARPWKGGRLRADWMWLRDVNYELGRNNHIYGGDVWQDAGPHVTFHAGAHAVEDEARDVRADTLLFHQRWGLSGQLGFFALLRERGRMALAADHLQGVMYDEQRFWQVRVLAEKSIGKHVAIGGGADVRELMDRADSTPLNRAFQRYWLGPRLRGLPRGFEAGLAGELWRTPPESGGNAFDRYMLTVGADASYWLRRIARFQLGTDYARYRYDFFLGEEHEDSRRYWGAVEAWVRRWGLRGRVKYDLEDSLGGLYHTLWLMLGVFL